MAWSKALRAPAVTALLVATGAGYDGNFAVNAPGSWMPAIRYLVGELGFDVNQPDHKENRCTTPPSGARTK